MAAWTRKKVKDFAQHVYLEVFFSPNTFLTKVNSRSRSLYAVGRPSIRLSAWNARAPYSAG